MARGEPDAQAKGPQDGVGHANFPQVDAKTWFALATPSPSRSLPVAAAANAAYVRAVAAGSGDLDFSAVVETCRPRGWAV